MSSDKSPIAVVPKTTAEKIVALVARSFDPADEAKIDPILKFFDSFKALGFVPLSAERSEVESVSEKDRSMIDKSDVLVGIFTRRHPVYRFDGSWRTTLNILSRCEIRFRCTGSVGLSH
jgi:hypothetical protein